MRLGWMTADLESSGLSHMTISYDDFHVPFIRPECIRNALNAASNCSIPTIVNVCVSRTHDSIRPVKRAWRFCSMSEGDSIPCAAMWNRALDS